MQCGGRYSFLYERFKLRKAPSLRPYKHYNPPSQTWQLAVFGAIFSTIQQIWKPVCVGKGGPTTCLDGSWSKPAFMPIHQKSRTIWTANLHIPLSVKSHKLQRRRVCEWCRDYYFDITITPYFIRKCCNLPLQSPRIPTIFNFISPANPNLTRKITRNICWAHLQSMKILRSRSNWGVTSHGKTFYNYLPDPFIRFAMR